MRAGNPKIVFTSQRNGKLIGNCCHRDVIVTSMLTSSWRHLCNLTSNLLTSEIIIIGNQPIPLFSFFRRQEIQKSYFLHTKMWYLNVIIAPLWHHHDVIFSFEVNFQYNILCVFECEKSKNLNISYKKTYAPKLIYFLLKKEFHHMTTICTTC